MATSQTQPSTSGTAISVSKTVFDLSSKDYVKIQKQGISIPINSAEEFTSRLNNDAELILKLMREALESYDKSKLADDSSIPWKAVDEDEEGNETLTDLPEGFSPISESKAKQLSATVINFAKLLFGYSKTMVVGDVTKNREAKKEAKEKALQAILASPAAVEKLKD